MFAVGCLYINQSAAQNIDRIIDNIYKRIIEQESQLDSLGGYSYRQTVNFKKLDGDGEIDQQSIRDFLVKVRSKNQRYRELVSAKDFEDGVWIDVTHSEKNKKYKPESQGHQFSLTEMVSPEQRIMYRFNFIGRDTIDRYDTIHLFVEPIEESEEKFAGDLWVEKNQFNLVKAILTPSENPTGVESLMMIFEMRPFNAYWFPQIIIFDARISFLIFFKGALYSEIEFSDYRFNQTFADSLFYAR